MVQGTNTILAEKKDKLKASIKKPVKTSKKPLSKYEGPSLIFTYYCIVRILSVVNAYSILTKQQLLVKLYKASSVKLLKNLLFKATS